MSDPSRGPERPPSFWLRTTPTPKARHVRIELGGGLDLATVGLVAPAVNAIVRVHRPVSLEIDLTKLFFMAGCGVDALMSVRVRVQAAGCAMVVTHPRRAIRRVLTATGSWDVLNSGAATVGDTTRRRRPVLNPGAAPSSCLLDEHGQQNRSDGWPHATAVWWPEQD